METKVVYTLISSKNDIYLEQMWLSIYSLKIYNPKSYIVVLVDENTSKYLAEKIKLIPLINEIKRIDIPDSYSPKEKSRFLKTSVRQVISGRCLFLDTDTIITGSLEELDTLDLDIACVPDLHTSFSEFPFRSNASRLVRKIFGVDVSDALYYFNSGVIFMLDTLQAHTFYEIWQKNWIHSAFNKNVSTDQQAMIKTDKELGYIIKELGGEYNCQILGSIQFLHNAKIIHFFNATWLSNNNYSPFFEKDLYLSLKRKTYVDNTLDALVRNCKSSFYSPTMVVNKKYMNIMLSHEGRILFFLYEWRMGVLKLVQLCFRRFQKLVNYIKFKK